MRRPAGERGQTLAEFALVLPVFLLMLFGAIDIGRVIWAADALANAAREGARFASVRGDTPGDTDITPDATKDDIRSHALGFVVAGGTNTAVTVCYSTVGFANSTVGCSGDADQSGASSARGNLVTVRVTADVPMLTGTLIGLPALTVSGSSTVLINN